MIVPLSEWKSSGIELFSPLNASIDAEATAPQGEHVVYDLHVGKAYYAPGPDAGTAIKDGQKLTIKPGDARCGAGSYVSDGATRVKDDGGVWRTYGTFSSPAKVINSP